MERARGFEPPTFCLGSRHSAAELRPRSSHRRILPIETPFLNPKTCTGEKYRTWSFRSGVLPVNLAHVLCS